MKRSGQWMLWMVASLLGVVGCENASQTTNNPSTAPSHQTATSDDHGHAHPTEGPHHGELVELGNEEFHAELIHSDSELTIYILDSAATKEVPISASELTVNVVGQPPQQFKIAAAAGQGNADGKSAQFRTDNKELIGLLDQEGSEIKLVVDIEGKSYRGDLHHSHEGHSHDEHEQGHEDGDHDHAH